MIQKMLKIVKVYLGTGGNSQYAIGISLRGLCVTFAAFAMSTYRAVKPAAENMKPKTRNSKPELFSLILHL